MTSALSTEAILVPIGQSFGTFYEDPRVPDPVHSVRVGKVVRDLGDHGFLVWSMLHGLPEQGDPAGFPHEALRATAEVLAPFSGRMLSRALLREVVSTLAGLPETRAGAVPPAERVGGLVDDLLRDGLACEIEPGEDGVIEFARTHRVHSRMLGLGNSPEAPGLYSIGLFNLPLVTVPRIMFNIWEWSIDYPTLWSQCEGLAKAEREAGVRNVDLVDPRRILGQWLENAPRLLPLGVFYFDLGGFPR